MRTLSIHPSIRIACAFFCTPFCAAYAGPPYATDDPEPTDYSHFEIYLYSQGVSSDGIKADPELGLEVNYGLLPDVQISASFPVGYTPSNRAYAKLEITDVEFGVKYRFIEEDVDGWRPQISVYPSLQPALRDFGGSKTDGTAHAFLPVWVQKSFGAWTTFGGGGYFINTGRDAWNSWFFGWAITRQLSHDFQLGTEVYRQTADARNDKDVSGFNIGAIYDLNAKFHLVASAGVKSGCQNPIDALTYFTGMEWTS